MTNKIPQFQDNPHLTQLFSNETLEKIFPSDRTNDFFEALLGDASEGAYDIRLIYQGIKDNHLYFAFQLTERPDKCLVCSVTYGLPKVFERHRVIDTNNVVQQIQEKLSDAQVTSWELGATLPVEKSLHLVPLIITLNQAL